jgi:hypothetical protein
VRPRQRRATLQGIESLEDRRMMSLVPGTLLGTTPVGPVLATQGTLFGPIAVGNFQVVGSYNSSDFTSGVNFGDGSSITPGAITATPGPQVQVPNPSGQNFTVTGGTGPDITINANLSSTAGQQVGPNNNIYDSNPLNQPVTFTAGASYNPTGLTPPFDGSQLVGRLVANDPSGNPIATLKPQGNQNVPAQSGDGAPLADQRRGEVLMTFGGGFIKANGLTGAFNSNPANAEIIIAESGNEEYLSVSLIGRDASGASHQTGFYFQVPISTGKAAPGTSAAAYTAIDLDFVAAGSIGAAAQALGIVEVTGVAIQAIRAGFYDPANQNTAYDVINTGVSGTDQFGQVQRRGIDFYANSADTGNPAVLPPAGLAGLPHYAGGSYAALDDPDILYVAAGANSLFMPTTNVIVNAGHRFLEDGTYNGTTSLNLANGGALVGTQNFQSNVDPLVLTYTAQPTIDTGVVVTGTLAVTDAPPSGYPNPQPQFYTATVDWGDGTSSPALVQDANGDGILEIVNNPNRPHAYTAPGTYTILISLFTDNVLVSTTSGQIAVTGVATPPTVTSVQRLGYHHQPTRIVVQFSQPLDPASAQNVANYNLVTLIHGGRRISSPFAFRSAVYDPTSNSVTLYPTRQLALRRSYRLTVNGTEPEGVRNSSGVLLNGGTNSVVSFTALGAGAPRQAAARRGR